MFNLFGTIVELINLGYEINFRKQSSSEDLFVIKVKKDDHIVEYGLDLEAMERKRPNEAEYEILKFIYNMKYELEVRDNA